MTIALDASSPTSFDLTGDGAGGASGTSASFTPPVNSWVYIGITIACGTSRTPAYTPTNTGAGLSAWTLVDTLGASGTQGGAVAVYRAFVNSSVATTVSVSLTNTGLSLSAVCGHVYVDVWTGANASQAGAAFIDAHSTVQNISPTVITTATGSQVSSIFNDESANGNPTSTDTLNARTSASQSDARIYKAANSGAAGAVAINANGAAGGTQWSYILYEILAPGGATDTLMGQIWV